MRSTIRLAIVACSIVALVATAVPAQAQGAGVRQASLTGAKEVPGPGDSDGVGRAAVIVHPRRGVLCFIISVDNITLPAAAAHVHVGPRTVAGPVVVTLEAPDEHGVSAGCVREVARRLLRDIKQHPRRYYVNVHTSDFPDGAVRGQLHR
jgi:CHRD domain-containing protein